MHLFIIRDSVGENTADSISMVSVEISSYPVLFLFGNLDIMHITNITIKRAEPALIKSLTLMVNQISFTGIFLDSLNISKVKPLFKAGDPVLISNNRPISLLPSLSKIFEHIIFRQLFDYMTDHNLFAIEQYGFRSGHSTELAALHLIDYLTKQMGVGEIPINI